MRADDLVKLVIVLLTGCSGSCHDEERGVLDLSYLSPSAKKHSLERIVKDISAQSQVDVLKPFQIDLGRGSGLEGLDTVSVFGDGRAIVYRRHVGSNSKPCWQKTTMVLAKEELKTLVKSVTDNNLLALHKEYHAAVSDGTQWVLCIKQGDKEKAVYFDNFFPEPIIQFARTLDSTVSANGSRKVRWTPVSDDDARKQQKTLWESIQRRKAAGG